MANNLNRDKQLLVVSLLCEGMGIRPIERTLRIHRDTVMRLGRDIGEAASRLHEVAFVNLNPERVELDEAWSFVFKKQARLTPADPRDYGDQYSFIALDSDSKAILAYHVGKRTKANTIGFALDLASRVDSTPQLTSDGFEPYRDAIEIAFGSDADYAMLIKEYQADCAVEAARRFRPADVTRVKKIPVSGDPEKDFINTAYVERQNLTLRMLTRRFNRLTNAFSKTLRNHRAAFDLYVGYYNFCWIHSALNTTPAVAAGVTDHPWSVVDFFDAVQAYRDPTQPPLRSGDVHYADYLKSRQKQKRGRR